VEKVPKKSLENFNTAEKRITNLFKF